MLPLLVIRFSQPRQETGDSALTLPDSMKKSYLTAILLLLLLAVSGCQSTYYAAMERSGVSKQEMLVNRVAEARNAQLDAQRQYREVLDQYRNLVQAPTDSLAEQYAALSAGYAQSEPSARTLHRRIEQVQDVAQALFAEWKDELDQYHDPRMKATSTQKFTAARQQYELLLASMQAAEKRITPVQNILHDRLLWLKHNLNAHAIQGLQGEYNTLSINVDQLLQNTRQAANAADVFIKTLQP